jgi:hypothetical protein
VELVVAVLAVHQTMMVLLALRVLAVVVVEQEEITIQQDKQEQVVQVSSFFGILFLPLMQYFHLQIQDNSLYQQVYHG